ncbi:hypothetical protein PZ895_02090 [Mesorhizobium sp. YIM 152430]|jgi:hypothetical protein|uniref:hypothetical protein n=1 Tax=Mesorhizobium sp. YIM 152430 TaxID=3031761 RepID=UPI0023DB0E8F|nr:hypothetical protein [Mesorhizobium sp. YIM 152430]MDF1598564.1 hypothetical protein [Mesorhizobium sp. YIM 152430]
MTASTTLSRGFALLTVLALAGCAGSNALQPNALTSTQEEAIAAASPNPAGRQTASLAAAANPQLAIPPAIGAPETAIAPLNARLVARAQELGIPLGAAASADGLTMKGYFSAITEGQQTTVIYVWDVIDGQGNRLTRIQGQERGPRTAGEGWTSVGPDMMQRIADQTIDAYASWLLARAG